MPSTLLGVLLLAALHGCELIVGPVCTDEARPGIIVEIRDSISDAPVATGARVIARDGAFADTTSGRGLAFERAGTYTVTVEHEGYAPWSRSGVRVTKDECHVRTVSLVALLQR